MHRTLKADAIQAGVAQRMYLQQRAFDRFRHEYNTERPHEALGYRVPAAAYVASTRAYPVKLRSPEYSNDRDVYVVRADGTIRMPGRDLFLSQALMEIAPAAERPVEALRRRSRRSARSGRRSTRALSARAEPSSTRGAGPPNRPA